MLRVRRPECDGDSNHTDPFLSKPSLPDEDGDDENSSQDEEGEDPEGHQDSHLLQGVTAVWDRETVMAKRCHRPRYLGDPIASSWTPQLHIGMGQETLPITLSHSCAQAGSCLQAVPTPTHQPQLYSLMGSGLGAWEGSSARLSRLASVVVSSLAVVARSGRMGDRKHSTKSMGSTPGNHRVEQRRMPLCPRGPTSPEVPTGC